MVLEIGSTEPPEAHVLDAARHEVSRATRIKVDVFDLERQRVQQLSDQEHPLRGPVKHHDAGVVLPCEALASNK